MVKRIKIGLIFGIDNKWIAGAYYLMNLVHALNRLPDSKKPHIVFLSSEQNKNRIEELNYPYFSIKNPYKSKRNYFEAAINKLYKAIFKKDLIIKHLNDKHIDCIYPASFDKAFELVSKQIFWIPDFQHHYYPEFFTEKELDERNFYFSKIAQKTDALLILSSKAALADFKKFYPNAKILVKTVPFAVTHPNFSGLSKEMVFKKYQISKPYFIVSNQFWQHKNHITVLKALKFIVENGEKINFQIIFTGKADDYRAPEFFKTLSNYISENNLQNHVKFVGFISRQEQLFLMKNSIAVIQPSLFEGWSTVVEDAKALTKFIILSDIAVHKEQINKNVDFFGAKNDKQLAQKLIFYAKNKPKEQKINYEQNILQFGIKFQKAVSDFL